jgi:hypothetical protein
MQRIWIVLSQLGSRSAAAPSLDVHNVKRGVPNGHLSTLGYQVPPDPKPIGGAFLIILSLQFLPLLGVV